MAQTGYTPIKLYASTTASAVPLAANLDNTNGAELAINIADEKLYFKNSSGVVKLLASSAGASGSVTTLSVVSANGFGGSVANATTTPAITLTTSVSGLLKGNGTGVSAAVSGTDYAPATSGSSILYGNGAGGFSNVTVGSGISFAGGTLSATGSGGTVTSVGLSMPTGFSVSGSPVTGSGTLAVSTTLSGMLKGTGSGFTTGTAGTDYVAPGTATTFTALQTFSGTSSNAAMMMANAKEVCTISATAATGTINYDATTQSVLYYTSNASANWTVNFRGSSGTSLNTLMNTGESITLAFLVTQGATAYYNNAVTVDGASVTPKYQGGTAWTAGNASSIDAYVYTIVKTGNAAFTVFASQTQFK